MSGAGAGGPDPGVSGAVGARSSRTVGVIGGGRMGAGIAHAFLLAGSAVIVVERDGASADAATRRIRDAVAASVERGAGLPPEGLLTVTVDWEALAGSDLVVEAVPEQLELKVDALRHAESLLDDDAVLATNTSSLSIDTLAETLTRPAAFLGMHFFNPVPASALVEVVVGAATAPATADAARDWAETIGKTAVVVRDSPGFASSRLGVLLGLEAIRMVEEGVASPADIDAAMVLGYKHPVGPLRLTDIVGLDVRLDIAEYLSGTLGERFRPPELLRRMVAEGRLGRKSGAGFYDWPANEPATSADARERR